MTQRNKFLIPAVTGAVSLALFILLILLTKNVDVAAVEATGGEIGLSKLNQGFHALTGFNKGWYTVTQITGIVAILTASAFAVTGVVQLIRTRSLRKVEPSLPAMGIIFAVTVFLYVLFDKLEINFRPIIMEGKTAPEASFPSSHTMLVCVVAGAAFLVTGRFVKDRRLQTSIRALCVMIALITVFGRLISGVHWLTDIVGAIFMSVTLLALFCISLPLAESIAGRKKGDGNDE